VRRRERHQRRAPTAALARGQAVLEHVVAARELRFDGAAQRAGAFTVDDADLVDAALLALVQVVVDERLDLFGSKRVQVELAVDRVIARFVQVEVRSAVRVVGHELSSACETQCQHFAAGRSARCPSRRRW
jgi:hypothetical protein